ncbi:MAG TPA: zinc ribbon domain-containing protein [Acidobacteriaceae bacterium]|nr:zinc ribbon domain-containing protein [Acidobacteriaceae bacterium]
MQEYCHRCGGELAGDTAFCPHCGAPQLTLALEQQSPQTDGEVVDGLGPTTGSVPPPRPRQVEWKIAIRCALLVAAIGAVLTTVAVRVDLLSFPSLLWMLSASMITLGLYQKQRPSAWIDARVGMRIGVVVGLCMALGIAASMAGWGLVERYALHGMSSFDAQMAAQMAQAQQQLQDRAAADKTPLTPELIGFVKSPEFRAGAMLAGYAMLSAVLLVVSVLGGAFGGLLRMRRRV